MSSVLSSLETSTARTEAGAADAAVSAPALLTLAETYAVTLAPSARSTRQVLRFSVPPGVGSDAKTTPSKPAASPVAGSRSIQRSSVPSMVAWTVGVAFLR